MIKQLEATVETYNIHIYSIYEHNSTYDGAAICSGFDKSALAPKKSLKKKSAKFSGTKKGVFSLSFECKDFTIF
jgi:hypothetical protein